MAVRLGR